MTAITQKTGRTAPKYSLRAAINAKCRDCIYDPKSGLGTWRQQVEACTCLDCPLYPVRPRSEGAKTGLLDPTSHPSSGSVDISAG